MCCRRCFFGAGLGQARLFNVRPTSFLSCRFAPSTVRPRGTPAPSVSKERLVPLFARSVGFFPHFFPAQRGLRYRAVERLPFPLDSLQRVVLEQPGFPQSAEHAPLYPLLKAAMERAARAELAMAPPSTGSRCAEHRRCRRRSSDCRSRAGHPSGSSAVWATTVRCVPTFRRAAATPWRPDDRPSLDLLALSATPCHAEEYTSTNGYGIGTKWSKCNGL